MFVSCMHSFSVESDAGIPLGCIIRALPDTTSREDFTVESVNQLSGVLPLQDSEDLVGNIIKVSHSDEEFKVSDRCRKQSKRLSVKRA